jgi:hypothetical protein
MITVITTAIITTAKLMYPVRGLIPDAFIESCQFCMVMSGTTNGYVKQVLQVTKELYVPFVAVYSDARPGTTKHIGGQPGLIIGYSTLAKDASPLLKFLLQYGPPGKFHVPQPEDGWI